MFRSQEQAPTSVPFQHFDDKAIVVLDPDDGDDSALRLAYMWARWTVRRGLATGEQEGLDLERIHCLLDDAARALERHTAIKRFHTQAKKSIDQAAEQVRDLVGEVHESPSELARTLSTLTFCPLGAASAFRSFLLTSSRQRVVAARELRSPISPARGARERSDRVLCHLIAVLEHRRPRARQRCNKSALGLLESRLADLALILLRCACPLGRGGVGADGPARRKVD